MSTNALTANVSALPPAPLSAALDLNVRRLLGRLDPDGKGYSLAAEDAPDPQARKALQLRSELLTVRLAPCGRQAAAKVVGSLAAGMKKRPRSEAEADLAVRQMIEGLAGLPIFALDAAALDFINGTVGDRWMPDLADIRPHAISKSQSFAREKRQIEQILGARIRSPVNTARRSQVLATAAQLVKEMPLAGRQAEAERAGRVIEYAAPESPEQSLSRLKAEAENGLPPISDELRRHIGLNVEQADHPEGPSSSRAG